MTPEEAFAKTFKTAHDKNAIITIGRGTAVEVTDNGCTVQRVGRPELFDVNFFATDERPETYSVNIPKEGSAVIYGLIENQSTDAVIIACSEIEKVLVKVGEVSYEIDSTGHLVKKGDDTAAKILGDFIDEVSKIIVINGRSPNKVKLAAIKARVTNLFK